MSDAGALVLIMTLAVLAPALTYLTGRWLAVPVVVVEILLGVLVGPAVLGLLQPDDLIEVLSQLGLCTLIFLAGYEIDFAAVSGPVLRRSVCAWLVSLALGLGAAVLIATGGTDAALYVGVALTSTALGTVLPVLRDTGGLRGRLGSAVLTYGAVGEFGPIIAVALLLSGRAPGRAALVLTAFALLTAGAVYLATRPKPPWFAAVVARTLDTSAHLPVRFVMLLLAAMLAISSAFGLDVLLGAFAAGVLTRLVLRDASPADRKTTMSKIEGFGFGFLVPLFFISTGVGFDLDALLGGGRPLLLLGLFLLLFLLVRGLPVLLLAPPGMPLRERAGLGLYCSTALPLIVAITSLGVSGGALETAEAAALVGAGMLSVLLFPLLATRCAPGGTDASPTARRAATEGW
ncbi:cation:proton antiporter [Streptomyces durbertensis]|uniref:Cation:proton antiporter n=1 Tax=Streptomyces durbertensis TaxID=2448886 RepID=A0ABR6EF34_9ACTN|nr:cation:proton antiporter [Streptomyces durbertensis]MBB1243937.1 cation:proton antiporter [Streptomyces durbertensis]